MVNLCCILNCISRNSDERTKHSLFALPKNASIRDEWMRIISLVNGKPASLASFVCDLHFDPENICRYYSWWDHQTIDVPNLHIRKKPKLRANAIPTIFQGILPVVPSEGPLIPVEEVSYNGQEINIWSNETPGIKLEDTDEANEQQFPVIKMEHFDELNEECIIDSFNELLINLKTVNLPFGWNYIYDQTAVTFYLIKHTNIQEIKAVIDRQIVLISDLSINFYVNDKLLEVEDVQTVNLMYPLSLKSIEDAIITFSNINVCVGGPMAIDFPDITDNNAQLESNNIWHRLDCPRIISSNRRRSLNCEKLLNIFRLKKLKYDSSKITKKYLSYTRTNKK